MTATAANDEKGTSANHVRDDNPREKRPTHVSTSLRRDSDVVGWPSMHDEIHDMIHLSIVAYAFTSIRNHARKGKFSDEIAEAMLTLPSRSHEICELILQNEEEFKTILSESRFTMIQDVMRSERLRSSEIVVFDDKENEDELVYGISVNPVQTRITVFFRGTVTAKDMMIGTSCKFHDLSLVLEGTDGGDKSETVGVHGGFYKYLFKKCKTTGQSKFEKIERQLRTLLMKYPNYSVYSTGHSLGGALCTLFSFKAAYIDWLPKPISCISIASPKCGNIDFCRDFQTLEKQDRVRCLRVVHDKDLVTYLPLSGRVHCPFTKKCKHSEYRHVGIELKLEKKKEFEMLYSARHSKLGDFLERFGHPFKSMLEFHRIEGYRQDFGDICGNLADKFLNDISMQSVSQRLPVHERVSQVVTEVGEGQELKLDEKITFQVRPEKIRFITYIWFWTMCILAIILNNYIVKPRLLAGPPASWPPEQYACPPFQGGELYGVGEIAPGQGFDVSTESHLIRAFGFNNICSNWDYSPSREITAAYYPGFEYSLILYIILDFWVVTLHYKKGLVPRYFYLTFMISFPVLIVCSAWFRLIFVGIAYENVEAHTFGFLTLQIVLIAVACFEVWFIIAAKMEYRMLCGYTKYVALVLLLGNLIISSIKFYLTAYVVSGNGYPRWANTCDGEVCVYPPGHIVDMIWMVFNAFIPLVSSFVRSLSEKPLEFTIDLASPTIKHVGWNDGEGGGWEDVEQRLTDLSE